MNMITNILARLPGLKSSADFDAAITDLETEHASALAAVGELEAGREAAIFDGGNLAALEADISAAEGRAKTLAVALEGARKRRETAIEAERMAELEATAAAARKLNTKLRARLIDFGKVAEELAGHAETIKGLCVEITAINTRVRTCGRADLAVPDPFRALAAVVERQVADPVTGLVIPEFWPRRMDGDGPALLRLRK